MATRIVETVVEYESQPPCKTAEEMEDLCCKPTNALQCCEHTEPNWQGATAEELLKKYHPDLDDKGRDSQGRYVVVELAPRSKPCGELVTEYDLSGGNCCDEVIPMEWDENASVDFIADNSSGFVTVTPGSGKYRWETLSPGAFVDAARSKKVVDTANSVLVVYTDSDACGMLAVKVNDGCTSLTREIRAETGQWVDISDTVSLYGCGMPGYYASEDSLYHATVIQGRYKQVESWTYNYVWLLVGLGLTYAEMLAATCPQISPPIREDTTCLCIDEDGHNKIGQPVLGHCGHWCAGQIVTLYPNPGYTAFATLSGAGKHYYEWQC